MRSTPGPVTRRRHKKVIKLAKGYRGLRNHLFRQAKNAVMKAYRDRRLKKRTFRALWNVRINAGCRALGINYSLFMNKLFKNKIVLNRKMLADLAFNHPTVFESVVNAVK
jgi:large subunit ribosomal protein L20